MNLKEYLLVLKNKIMELKKEEREEIDSYITPYMDDIELLLETDDGINTLLELEIQDFFPKTGGWYGDCFSKSNKHDMIYLPCHLRDNIWLAKMFRKENDLRCVSLNRILDFINNSEIFAKFRHNYELEIVKWQIDWIRNGGENWLASEELGGDFCLMMPQCDIAFRKGVVDTLKAIGMNEDVIEEGLEKNAYMWRDRYISSAFDNNTFNSTFGLLSSEEYKNAWIRMREFEYYQKHKKSVDLYGQATEAMKMSGLEIAQLQMYLARKFAERINYIEECKEDKIQKRVL